MLPNFDALEDRKLMSFGGGNIDTTIARFPSTSPQLNYTSNSFHQVNDKISGVASSIVANPGGASNQLATFVSHIPNGTSQLLPILQADLQTFQAATGTVTTAQATATLDKLYETLLGRQPDGVGLAYGIPALQHGTTVAQVASKLVTSTEYIQDNITAGATGNQNQTQFVTALYNDVLGRAPEGSGLSFWVSQINTGALSVQQVANDFVSSNEAATSPTSILKTAALPVVSPVYYFGVPAPDGTITGNFSGTSKVDQLKNLLQQDLITYLGKGVGNSFNILKSGVNFGSDRLLTYNGRV